MIDVALIVVIVALLGYMAWDKQVVNKERSLLIRALKSKNAVELRDLEAVDKLEVKADISEQPQSDLMPAEEASDNQFDKAIKEVIKNAGEKRT